MIDLTVLVTRPALQGEKLCALIQGAGGRAIHFPTIVFAPAPDPAACQQAVAGFGGQEWLIFISPQAVHATIRAILDRWPQLPPRLKIAAVGEGTARVLQDYGYQVDRVPARWSSEGLLELPAFQASVINGKGVAVIRGEGGREIIDKILAERGAHVLPVIAYRRVQPDVDVSRYLDMLERHTIDIIVCASLESARNLKSLFGDKGWHYLKEVPLLVVSERISTLVQDLGFQNILVSGNASDEAILEILRMRTYHDRSTRS